MTDDTPHYILKVTTAFIWTVVTVLVSIVLFSIGSGFWFANAVTGPIADLTKTQISLQNTLHDYHEDAVNAREVQKKELDDLYHFIYQQGRNGKNDRNHMPPQPQDN